LEICVNYSPELIGPNLPTIIEDLRQKNWNKFACVCGDLLTSETSHRCHIINYHRLIMEMF